MKAFLKRSADTLQSSYWFIPTLLAGAAILLAGAMIWLDTHVASGWMDALPWLQGARPDGARQVLAAIGGSMITVAGTVFSVTIASVVFASGQYGPRLLANFMSDKGNQVTLGTFIATFVYCLLVLRTIRSPDENGGAGFVPNLALLVAVAMALSSIAVLIFFIHHVPSKLHINSVIESVGRHLLNHIDDRFPTFLGEPAGGGPSSLAPFAVPETPGAEITSRQTGYVQYIDEDALMRHASSGAVLLKLHRRPGDFVHLGRTLVEVWPSESCDDTTAAEIRAAFAVGDRRTPLQDLRFLMDELVEIAARALSPGLNDPFTAVTCLDWLGAAISSLADRAIPSAVRVDDEGAVRVVACPDDFEHYLERTFGGLAQYCAPDAIACVSYVNTLAAVSSRCRDPARDIQLRLHAVRIEAMAAERLDKYDLEKVRTALAALGSSG